MKPNGCISSDCFIDLIKDGNSRISIAESLLNGVAIETSVYWTPQEQLELTYEFLSGPQCRGSQVTRFSNWCSFLANKAEARKKALRPGDRVQWNAPNPCFARVLEIKQISFNENVFVIQDSFGDTNTGDLNELEII